MRLTIKSVLNGRSPRS